ncbi:uncharacterized protein LOC144321352 [Canis aureus]
MSFRPKDQFEPKAFKHPAGSEAVAAAYLVRALRGRWFDSGSKEVPDAFAPSGKPRPRSARPASAPRRPWQPGVAVFPQAQVGETFRAQPPTQPRVRCRQGHTPAPSSRSLPTRASPRPFHSFPFPPQTDSSGRRACALGQPPRRPGVWAFVKTVPLHLGLGLGLLPHLPGRGGPCFRPSQLLQALSPSSLPLVWSRKIRTYGDRRPPDLLGGTGLAHLRVLVPKPLPTARSRRGGRWPKRDAAGAPTGLAVVMSKNLGGAFGSLVDGRTLEASRAVAPVPAAAGGSVPAEGAGTARTPRHTRTSAVSRGADSPAARVRVARGGTSWFSPRPSPSPSPTAHQEGLKGTLCGFRRPCRGSPTGDLQEDGMAWKSPRDPSL